MDHLSLLGHEMAAMTAALRATDPGTIIEGCPGWTLRELAGHVTGVHRWALKALDNEGPGAYDETPDDGDLAEAYDVSSQALLKRLVELPADTPAWTFNRDDQTAGFWHRRQLHEVAVHRWDAQPYTISDEVATDGIDEVFDFFLPRGLAQGRTTLPEGTLRLVSPDRTWTVGTGDPQTTVEGTPHELLLSLYRRGRTLPGPWAEARLTP